MEAVLRIQALARGRNVRKKYKSSVEHRYKKSKSTFRESYLERSRRKLLAEQHDAAVKIQKVFRFQNKRRGLKQSTNYYTSKYTIGDPSSEHRHKKKAVVKITKFYQAVINRRVTTRLERKIAIAKKAIISKASNVEEAASLYRQYIEGEKV